MKYTEGDIRRIKNAAEGRLLDVVQDFHQLRKSGSDYVGDCPHCHAAKKFTVAPNKDIFKCFSCNEISGKGAISYLMTAENMSYLDAMDYLVRKFSVILDAKPEKKPVKLKVPKKKSKDEFLQELEAMGIASSGDKTTDKLKLETAKTYLEMLQSQSSSSLKDRDSIPFDDVMNTLNLTITGDLDEDYDTTIDKLDYEIALASSDEEAEYYEDLIDLVESDYNTAKQNRISYASSYSQTTMLTQYLAMAGLS